MSARPRIGPHLGVTQTQRLALNANLGVSIQLLRSDAAGLTRYLEEQAANNPHLRLDPPPAPGLHDWLPRWSGVLHALGAPDLMDLAQDVAPGLMVHVSAAIDRLRLPASQRRAAEVLTDALEPSGWLGQSTSSLAAFAGVAEDEVDLVLAKLQTIDPPGLFARNLSECLTLQAADLGVLDAPMQIILRNLDLLAAGDLARLSRLCEVTEAEVMARFRTIRSLNPKPGADFAPLAAGNVREPDLIVRATANNGWTVALNRSALPDLQVAPAANGSADQLSAARGLHRMVQARNTTLLRVAGEIFTRQRAALDHGPTALVAMTMAEVAAALDMHKSTVSRVVAGACIDTPKGTWWLRKLFSTGLGGNTAPGMAGAALRHLLVQIISAENRAHPQSDADLAARLTAQCGVPIARRTVAKYRKDQSIPTASRRKRTAQRPFASGFDAKGRGKG